MSTTLAEDEMKSDGLDWMEMSREDRSTLVPVRRITDVERDAIYADFQPLVQRLLRKFSDTPEMREDLSSEIYYRFSLLLEEYDPGRGVPLYAYLVRKIYTSAYAHARILWRQRNHQMEREVSWEEKEADGLQIGVPWEDPIEGWIAAERQELTLQAMREAIEGLTERQRQVVVWRYYEGLSFEEIAGRQGNQPATARSLLRHALNTLRARITETLDQSEKASGLRP